MKRKWNFLGDGEQNKKPSLAWGGGGEGGGNMDIFHDSANDYLSEYSHFLPFWCLPYSKYINFHAGYQDLIPHS